MPIPNIIASIDNSPIQMRDPMDRFSKAMQLKQVMQTGQQQDQALADERAVREAYQQSGGDMGKLRQLLSGGGQYRQLQALEKNQLEAEKGRVGIDKDKADITTKAIAQHRDQLANVNDPQQAAQWLQSGMQNPYIGPILSRVGNFETLVQRIPQDPAQFQQWKQQQALGATKFIEMNKPQILSEDTGTAKNTLSVPGLGGAPTVIRSTAKQMTPGEVATDLRGKEANTINRELKELQRDKLEDEKTGRERQKESSVATVQDSINVLDKALAHPGRETASGLSSILDPRNRIPGTEAKDFQVVLDQIKGKAFLQAFESLKGGGQITEVEGKKATDAIARLNTAQSDAEFKIALTDLRDVMTAGYKRLSNKDYKAPSATEFNSLPDPAKYKGKRMRGPDGIMRSNGTSWVMERG